MLNSYTGLFKFGRYNKTSNALAIVTSDLVLHLDAGNTASYSGTGTTWFDLGPYQTNGTLNNTTTFNAAYGGYFNLNNTGDRDTITIPYNAALNNSQPITVEIWLTSNALNYPYYYIQGSGWKLVQDNNILIWQQLLAVPGGGQGVYEVQASPATSYANANTWFQLCGTFTPGSRKLYLNGVQIAGDTLAYNRVTGGVDGILIGGQQFVWWGDGNIAIVRAYSAALSAAQVLQNFNVNKTRFGL